MSTKSFPLKVLILRSKLNIYKENKITRIYIKKKMGEGSYGIVYLLNDNNVIKIFTNNTDALTIDASQNISGNGSGLINIISPPSADCACL